MKLAELFDVTDLVTVVTGGTFPYINSPPRIIRFSAAS